ncbi:hypothetical protein NQ176_g8327 [Zarea fungicola]|uniref:Uncharacterized protein n=1 Tax=Zarea fungicola TaxID=93591 RepID=A0ACC1MSZ0_9HYPO|nr:hypothetical protein NQ176_g8327 [Lecanicillium fungicola]
MAASEENARYMANSMPRKALQQPTSKLLQSTLEALLAAHPVPETYATESQKGIFSGYTSLSYLLLQIHRLHPDLSVKGENLVHWARGYLESIRRESLTHGDDEYRGGLHNEKLCIDALYACITGNEADVKAVLASIPLYLDLQKPYFDELFYGRAGVLYLLRLVKTWVPSQADAIDEAITAMVAKTIQSRKDKGCWTIVNTRYYGPAHGDIGIIVQLVLSKPSIAPELQDLLLELISLQQPDGNWPTSEKTVREGNDKGLVQFCHGAPGFIISLQALRPFYPALEKEIDDAVSRGRSITWEKGLSRKEPSMCHGILGNAL